MVMMKNQQRIHVVISGNVQGVNFRYYTMQEANRLNVTGWVRNRTDGTVEVLAEGETDALEALHQFLHRGSPAARVKQVNIEWKTPTGEYSDFEIIR